MGKKHKDSEVFHIGKGFKRDSFITPIRNQAPNSVAITYNKKTGKFVSMRKFDCNGNAYVDLDDKHPTHKNSTSHKHTFNGYKRSGEQFLNKREKRIVLKAKKKRRFWNNGKK